VEKSLQYFIKVSIGITESPSGDDTKNIIAPMQPGKKTPETN